jgi:hypothetical protein
MKIYNPSTRANLGSREIAKMRKKKGKKPNVLCNDHVATPVSNAVECSSGSPRVSRQKDQNHVSNIIKGDNRNEGY